MKQAKSPRVAVVLTPKWHTLVTTLRPGEVRILDMEGMDHVIMRRDDMQKFGLVITRLLDGPPV